MENCYDCAPDKKIILDYLNGIYSHTPGFFGVFQLPSKKSKFFKSITEVANCLSKHCLNDIYVNICTLKSPPSSGRGKTDDIEALPAFWLDLDHGTVGHQSNQYFKNKSDARSFLTEVFSLPPTVLLHTGGGMLAIWLFKKPWLLADAGERMLALKYSKDFQGYFIQKARDKGFLLDNTSDLTRILRIPGTFNFKTGQPRPVRLLENHLDDPSYRYSAEKLLGKMKLNNSSRNSGNSYVKRKFSPRFIEGSEYFLKPILAMCSWMKHCQTDAAHLTEPEWYFMLTIVGRCRNAKKRANKLSQPYAGYSVAETEGKLTHAKKSPGPVTCSFVRRNFGYYCNNCIHNVKSPLLLGVRI